MSVFLSHSNADKELAHLIAEQIRIEMKSSVFVSSEPETIPSGDWFSSVMSNLVSADVIVLLITGSSVKSTWVAFEYGYFWGQKGTDKILFLRHPKATIPNPLDILQGKSILDRDEIKVFFQILCDKLGCTFQNKANIDAILQKAIELKVETPEEQAMRNLQEQIDYLANKGNGSSALDLYQRRGG